MKLCVELSHVTVDIIYNTRLFKWCQHMTVTYVVVTFVANDVDVFKKFVMQNLPIPLFL